MAKPNQGDERQTVIAAQNDALLRWPDDTGSRNKLVDDLRAAEKKESDAVKTARAAAGFKNAKDLLVQRNGWCKETVATVLALEKMAPDARARYCRQVMKVIEDRQYVYPDLFDNGAIGQPAAEPDAPVFDSTSEGQRRGGSKAEPRPAPEPAAAAPAREIPTLSLEEAQKVLDAELAKRDGKRGPEPKTLKEARAAVEMAKALEAEKGKAVDATTEQPAAAPAAPVKDNVVSFAREQASANAAGEDHIRQQAAKLQADREAKARGETPETAPASPPPPPPPPTDDDPDEPAAEAAPAEKPKRGGGRKKKDAEASAAPPPPPPPPTDDDEDEEGDQDGPGFPAGAPGMGADQERRPADFTIG